jgi:sulfur carrier protein
MSIVINGQTTQVSVGATVTDLVNAATGHGDPAGVAVAVNGTVVRRVAWSTTTVAEGDRIEVLTATAGG